MDNFRPKKSSSKSKLKKTRKDSLKVVYISSPMKVKASASEFRALVQELTGRNSDVARIMEGNEAADFEVVYDHSNRSLKPVSNYNDQQYASAGSASLGADHLHQNYSSSTTSSDSFLEPNFDDGFSSQLEEQFQGLFPSNLIYASSDIDVLGSYDAL